MIFSVEFQYSLNILSYLLRIASIHRDQLADWNHRFLLVFFWRISSKNMEKRQYLLLKKISKNLLL